MKFYFDDEENKRFQMMKKLLMPKKETLKKYIYGYMIRIYRRKHLNLKHF